MSFVFMSEEKLISRQEAAKMLRVSTRTIDRYIADQRLSVVKDQGRSLLRRTEVLELKDLKSPIIGQVVSALSHREEFEDTSKYKILYEDAKEQVEKRDELLRHMHYQLGKMEVEAKNMVPLLEANTKQQQLETKVIALQSENITLKTNLDSAKTGRMVFFSIAFISFLLLFLSLVL